MKQFSLSHRIILSAFAALILIIGIIVVGVFARGDNENSDASIAMPTDSVVMVNNTDSPVNADIETNTDAEAPAVVEQSEAVVSTPSEVEATTVAPEATTTAAVNSQKTETRKPNTPTEANSAPVAESAAETYTAVLTVRGPAGAENYAVDVDIGATVQDLMNAATTKGFSFKTKNFSSLGAYVTTINGVAEDSDAGMYWTYSINDKKATSGISSKKLKKGDTVQWSYEKEF